MPYTTLPKDPVILISFVNTQLRDHYKSLDEFCRAYETDKHELLEKLLDFNYQYNEELNRFL